MTTTCCCLFVCLQTRFDDLASITRTRACARVRATRDEGTTGNARSGGYRAVSTARTRRRRANDAHVRRTRRRDTAVAQSRAATTRRSPAPPSRGTNRASVCSPEQIRTAVTALRGRRPRPLDDGARLAVPCCELGGEDSNPQRQDQNLLCCRLHHPRRSRQTSGRVPPRSSRSRSAGYGGYASGAQPVEGALAAEEEHRVEQREPPVHALDRRVDRGRGLPDILMPSASVTGCSVERVDGSTRRTRRARSPRRAPRAMRSVLSTTAHDSGSIAEVGVVDEQERHLVDDLHERDRPLLRDARRPRGHDLEVERRHRTAPARAARTRAMSSSSSRRRIHSPLSQSSLSRSKPAAACVTRSRSNCGDELGRASAPRCRRRPAPIRAARGS